MSEPTRVQLSAPSALIAAIPAVLGFIPERSIILIAFADPATVAVTMRYDLDRGPRGFITDELLGTLDHLADICQREQIHHLVAVIVDDRLPRWADEYTDVFVAADKAMRKSGGITTGFLTETIDFGAQWFIGWSSDPEQAGRSGIIDDPATNPVAVASAVTGDRSPLRRRSELREALTPRPHCETPNCPTGATGPAHLPRTDAEIATEVAWLRTLVADRGGALDDCTNAVRAANALRHKYIRDCMFALADQPELLANAGEVWQRLACELRGEAQAAAATLLAHLHYLRGNGAMAAICLDSAIAAKPGYQMAELLDTALRNGMPPQGVAQAMADTGKSLVAELGDAIPVGG